MQKLSAAELLTLWERGLSQSAPQRALLLLAAAFPDTELAQLAQLSIGQRDAYLLSLREQTLGSQVVSVATCPNCDNSLELNFAVAEIRLPLRAEPEPSWRVQAEGCEVEFRLVNSLDLAAVEHLTDVAAAAHQLLQRCVLSVKREGQMISVEQLPAEVRAAVVEKMEAADPQSDVQLALQCPECGHEWNAPFDIVSFFWQEIHSWALRILREVHQLASAYGWREADILAMSPQRRQVYLEMISP
jgi:uncharacterized protein (UPF0212 family)